MGEVTLNCSLEGCVWRVEQKYNVDGNWAKTWVKHEKNTKAEQSIANFIHIKYIKHVWLEWKIDMVHCGIKNC